MSTRLYGEKYQNDLKAGLDAARDSVSSISYSAGISTTTVHTDRQWLKSSCVGAADDALAHINGVKVKLDNVIFKLNNYYGEVEETCGQISEKAVIAKGILDTLNDLIKMLCDSLLGTGDFKNYTVTGSAIDAIGGYVQNALPYYAEYYYDRCVNDDGSFNYDELDSCLDTLDTKVENGEPLSNYDAMVVNSLCLATTYYLDNHEFKDDEEFSEVLTQFVSRFYTQDFNAPDASDLNAGLCATVDTGDGTCEVIWYNYSLRPSSELFISALNSTLTWEYYASGDSMEGFKEKHLNSIQFNDCILAICRNNQTIALPYVITDPEAYEEYRNSNCVNPDIMYDGQIGDPFPGDDHYYVKKPFFGSFHVERETLTNGTFSDEDDVESHPSERSVITYSNDFGPMDYRYILMDDDGNPVYDNNGLLEKSYISYITVWSCESDFCRDLEMSQREKDGAFIASTEQTVKPWSDFWTSPATVCGLLNCAGTGVNGVLEANDVSVRIPSFPSGSGVGSALGSFVSLWCNVTGVPALKVIGGLCVLGGRALDFACERDAAQAYNAWLSGYLDDRDAFYDTVTFCRNTSAYGSYYADNDMSDTPNYITVLPNYYVDMNQVQISVSYACETQNVEPQVIGSNSISIETCEYLSAPDLADSQSRKRFAAGVEVYYTMFWTEHRNYPPFGALTTDDVNDVCNAFINDFWRDHPGERFEQTSCTPPNSIPGINPNDYR